jgi:hypothetical protein
MMFSLPQRGINISKRAVPFVKEKRAYLFRHKKSKRLITMEIYVFIIGFQK